LDPDTRGEQAVQHAKVSLDVEPEGGKRLQNIK